MDWLIAEWLVLVLVAPIVITIVVLLYGFVGCGKLLGPGEDPTLGKPDKPIAKAAGSNLIRLSWQSSGTPGVTFKIERTEDVTGKKHNFDAPGSASGADDTTDLNEGTTYFYTLKAALAGQLSDPSDQGMATTFPEAPADVDPRGADLNRIDLTWTNKSTKADKVVVEHESPTGVTETKTDATVPQPRQFMVDEGSEHKFRVFASTKGFQENVFQDDIRSAELPQKPAKPLAFKATLTSPEPPPTLAGYCIVQRLSSALLKNRGAQVWLTVSAPTVGQLKLNRIYISQPDPAGDPWDSAGAPTKVIDIDTNPAEQLSLAANDPPRRLDPIAFNLNQANDLLIAFDFSADAGDCLFAINLPGATSYYKAASQQAAIADRSPNPADPAGIFGADVGRHYLITQIEVL